MSDYNYPEKYRQKMKEALTKRLDGLHILVVKDKYSATYFDASSLEALYTSSLSLLKRRRKDDCWYYIPDAPPDAPSVTDEQRNALAEGPVRKAAEQELKEYKRELKEYESALDFINAVDDAIAKKDGLKSYLLLLTRVEHEYEGLELAPVYASMDEDEDE